MANQYLSYNVASSASLSGLNQLITLFNPIIIFLQEVTVDTDQLLAQVGDNFCGLSNIDPNDTRKPGTAVLWRNEAEVVVSNIVPLRIQAVYSKLYGNFINI